MSETNSTPASRAGLFTLGYRTELDGLRGLAIAMVLAGHLFDFGNPGLGVDLFFAMSSFLITTLLLEERDSRGFIDLKSFYMRRLLRLGPALLLAIALVWLGSLLALWPSPAFILVYVLTYTTNFAVAFGYLTTSHAANPLVTTWSLAVEEQFYALWPPLYVFLCYRLSRLQICRFLVASILLLEGWRWWLLVNTLSVQRIYYSTDTHGSVLLIGCLLAFVRRETPDQPTLSTAGRFFWNLAGIGILAIAFGSTGDFNFYTVTLTLWGAGMGILVWASTLQLGLWNKLLCLGWLRYLGKISYGVYLYHLPAKQVVLNLMEKSLLSGSLALILTVAVSAVSYHIVERKFLKMKKAYLRKDEPRVKSTVSTPA